MITAADYRLLSELLRSTFGLALGDGKEYLIESRLTPVALSLGLPDLPALLGRLRDPRDERAAKAVCEAMTTNESFFFRDLTPFTLIRERILPELIDARRGSRRLRVWCAAASTGQEPYSVAMILADFARDLAGWSVEVVATDYSRAALARARAGVYNHFEVQRGLPIQLLTRFFTKSGPDWRIQDEIRRAVTFREGNLIEPFRGMGTFDLVLCRNVLIYFDLATKRDILDRLGDVVAPDGYLFLGGSETAMGLSSRLERVADASTSLYRPAPSALSLAS